MIGFAVLVVLVCVGAPVGVAILLAVSAYIATEPFSIGLLSQRVFQGLDSFTLLAVPLFILAGELMNASGITARIISFSNALVGHLRAGLAQVNIWASVIFAGLSGSAVADTSALGRVFVPAMEREGYPRDFSAALTAASSVVGPIIPPSIPVLIYAVIVTGVSVPGLFLAGVGPGLLLAVFLSIYVHFSAGHFAVAKSKLPMPERLSALKDGIIPLLMPVFVVGSILLGVVTPTEAAAFAVAYALVTGIFVLRTLRPADLPGIFVHAMRDSASILLIVGAVAAANWLMTYARVPQTISQTVLAYVTDPWTFLIAVNVLFLAAGLVLEGIAAMLVLVPIVQPIALQLGIDPTHFGIVVIFNLMIGLITPPMGLCLFVADAIANVGMARLTRRVLPFFFVELAVLAIITFAPVTVVGLPRLLGF